MSARDMRLGLMGVIVAGLAMAGAVGCGGIGGDPVPVAGAVSLNDTPLPFARIIFHPQQVGGRTVAAVTDLRGRYDIRDGDRLGLPPGPYVITVDYYVSGNDSPQRPEPTVSFSGEGLKQLLPEKYSDEAQSELSALVLPPDAETEAGNVFIFPLTGDTVPLPSGAERFPGPQPGPIGDGSSDPAPSPQQMPSTFPIANLLVYVGGGLIFLAVVGGMLFLFKRQSSGPAMGDGSAYQYDGEAEGDSSAAEMQQPARAAPRRKKKRKKKKVRKKGEADAGDIGAPTLETSADEPEPEFSGSPFPVLDEGMDDDDVAAAFLAADDETVPAPKKTGEADVVKWMLSVGGFVKIQTAGKKVLNVKSLEALPDEKFQIQGAFFEGVEDFGDEELAKIKKLPHLDTLDLISTNISDAGLAALEKLPSIRTLALSRTSITDDGLEHLTALPNLRVLLLYRTHITDAGNEHLKKLTKLKTIELKKTELTEAGVQELQEQLPDCKVIA
ncbi:hypothetical protein [Symmachiella macrocystis]|nr:hypothetical protein [Symmachiella macrocystis]